MSNKLSPFHIDKIPEVIKCSTGKDIVSFEPIPVGVMNYKILCVTENGEEYIIRIYPFGRESILEKEMHVIMRCNKIGLPVPDIIITSLNGPDIGLNYLVYPKIEGMMLSSYLDEVENPDIDYIGCQLLNLFKKISTLKVKNHGDLINAYEASHADWNEFLNESIKKGREGLYKSQIVSEDTLFIELERFIISNLSKKNDPDNCLIWGDTSIDNILIKSNGEISGIIDFESCVSGLHNCTVGYFISTLKPKHKNHELLANFILDKSKIDNDEVYSFSLLRAYRLAEFINMPLPTGKKRDMLIDIFPGLKWAVDYFLSNYRKME
ncbi:aminoglycoside phosphotransferase family protein [Cronobacter dublinensis]